MIDYTKAKEIALNLNSRVNTCNEYQKAYHFFIKDNDSVGDNGVVVLKSSGKAIDWVSFILKFHPEKTPKSIEF